MSTCGLQQTLSVKLFPKKTVSDDNIWHRQYTVLALQETLIRPTPHTLIHQINMKLQTTL